MTSWLDLVLTWPPPVLLRKSKQTMLLMMSWKPQMMSGIWDIRIQLLSRRGQVRNVPKARFLLIKHGNLRRRQSTPQNTKKSNYFIIFFLTQNLSLYQISHPNVCFLSNSTGSQPKPADFIKLLKSVSADWFNQENINLPVYLLMRACAYILLRKQTKKTAAILGFSSRIS